MARFKFKLAGVLRHRILIEREKQRATAEVQARMAGLRGQLAQLDEQVQGTTADVRRNHLTGILDMNFLAAHRRYVAATQRQAMELAAQMAKVQRELETAQAALLEAAKQRKMLEKLRETQEGRWREDAAKKEMNDLDEAGMQLSFRAVQDEESKR